jgi:hypothetical protein
MFTSCKYAMKRALPAISLVYSSWNVMAHGDAWEGKWRGNWRMECVASTLHTTSEHGVSSITTADAHTSAASSRLNWRPRRFNPLNAELNPICHLLALLGGATIVVVSRLRVKTYTKIASTCFGLTTILRERIIDLRQSYNYENNRFCHLLALLGGSTIVVVSRLRVKWTRPILRKTKSGLCACAITFQLASTCCWKCSVLSSSTFLLFPFIPATTCAPYARSNWSHSLNGCI